MMKEDLFSGVSEGQERATPQAKFPEITVICLNEAGVVIQVSANQEGGLLTQGLPEGTMLADLEGNEWLKSGIQTLDKDAQTCSEGLLHVGEDGSTFEVAAYLMRLGGDAIIPLTYICFFWNLTGKDLDQGKTAEVDQLRIIAENAGDAISLHKPNGDFIYISPSVERLHGYSSAELMELGGMYPVHPDDRVIITELLEKIADATSSLHTKYRFIHKQGHIVRVESLCQKIIDNDGKFGMISVITRDVTVNYMLEENLRKNEEKYRTLVKHLPTGVLLMNTSGEILEVNQALLDILGSPGEEPTRMINMFEFENLIEAGITDDLKRCITERKIINGQAEYLSKWGKKCILLYSAVPVFDNEGGVIQIICNVRDITRMKKAEEKSLQQIEFLNIVINAMQEPFFVKDENHRWIMLNDAAIEMMGQPRESLIGKTDYELYPKEQADVFWEKDAIVFESGNNVNEEKINWSDGTERNIITYKRLYTEASTGKKYIVGTIHDITELKKSEEKLQESEKKYRQLFDNANDHIFTADLNGTFTNANKAMLETMDIAYENLGNYNIFSFVKPENMENAESATLQLMETGAMGPFEIETIEKEGKPVVLEVQARLILKDDIPVGIQGIARDISEKKAASQKLEKMNKELKELNASKDKFYSIIAHDLKNPFNSLIGFSDLMYEEFNDLSKEEMRDYVGIIRSTAKSSLTLLENLLAWSRLQTGRMIFNPVKLLLANEIDGVVTVLYSLSYRKKIHIENAIDRNLMVMADQNMLHSIMHNLVMNAIKFTPSNGNVVISGKRIQDPPEGKPLVEISVSDTGIGILPEDQSKLFSLSSPFTMQGTDKEIGTGLGLLLCKEMIEKHGGEIKVESEPGKGSTFSFVIPQFVPL